jgi:hypothetical protein
MLVTCCYYSLKFYGTFASATHTKCIDIGIYTYIIRGIKYAKEHHLWGGKRRKKKNQ